MDMGATSVPPEGPDPGRELTVVLKVVRVSVCPDGSSNFACPNCRHPLDVHQPDADTPERMLATCEACQGWFLADCGSVDSEVFLFFLPDPDVLRQGMR